MAGTVSSSTAGVSFTGLASGMDTASIVNSLIQVYSAPQTQLKNQLSTRQAQLGAYQALNTSYNTLYNAANALSTLSGALNATTVTSSATSVTASTDSTAVAGSSLTFAVDRVATSSNGLFQIPPGATVRGSLVVDGTTLDLSDKDYTAADVAAKVNGAGLGVKASTVATSSGTLVQVTSTTSGASTALSLDTSGLTPSTGTIAAPTVTAGQDAQISFTLGGTTYTQTSSTNTFTGVLTGVSFTVSQASATPVTLTVATDTTGITNKVKALVDALNAVGGQLDTDLGTTTGSTSTAGSVLGGDFTLRTLQQTLANGIAQGSGIPNAATGASSTSYDAIGISLDKNGTVTFDADKFSSALSSDPASANQLVEALSSSYSQIAWQATAPASGAISQAINGTNDTIANLNSDIADWTTKIADKTAQLNAQFSAMEVALARLQSQQTSLTNALKQLSGTSSSSTN